MSAQKPRAQYETEVRVQLVRQLLAGKSLPSVSAESGCPRKQLAFWLHRFLQGGEAYLSCRDDVSEIAELKEQNRQLLTKVRNLQEQNLHLAKYETGVCKPAINPKCSECYARAFEERGASSLYVPEWRTYVLVRQAPGLNQVRHATGLPAHSSLDPDCDLKGGLLRLRQEGIASISLITDPLWSPDLKLLQEVFESCRPFKENYLVDRGLGPLRIRKRHRNSINGAKKLVQISQVHLTNVLDDWWRLYEEHRKTRVVVYPASRKRFEILAELPDLAVFAAYFENEIVAMTIWLRFNDILYYLDGVSSEKGLATSAPYASFAHAIDHFSDCRHIFFGGSADFRSFASDGVALFKSGFANASVRDYLCTARFKSETSTRSPAADS
ncbi:MAG TPA: helix-turn-helix domain-containing protein [Terriglobales bacterium]